MRKLKKATSFSLIAILLISAIMLFLPLTLAAASETAVSNQHIYDNAELLSTFDREALEEMSEEYGNSAGVEIMILTHNDSSAVGAERYIEDFEDKMPLGDRVYFLYDVANGEIFIEGYGLAETYIHSNRINSILDEMEPLIRTENYYDAFAAYIKLSSSYMKDDSEINTDHVYTYDSPSSTSSTDNILTNIWFQLLASLIVGGIVVGIMAYNSSGRMSAGGSTYMDQSNSGLIGRRDDYVRTIVTRVRKPQQTNNRPGGGFNAGGFGGGMSAGGRSHSSGGRKL